MSAIYAFMRVCDDITDEPSSPDSKEQALNLWSDRIQKCLKGVDLSHPVFPALRDTVNSFNIPEKYLFELIEGVQMDLGHRQFQKFEDLYNYCYKVASIVGLVCVHIFGFKDERALVYAESCGIAFQLTNILRDLKEDAQMGRVYLPIEDFERFNYTQEELTQFKRSSQFLQLMQFEVERAEEFYKKGFPVIDYVDEDSRRALKVMIQIYHGILNKIRRMGFDTLTKRIHLNLWEKTKIILTSKPI